MDINASTLRSIYTGLSTAFNSQLSATATFYNAISMTVPSSTAMNEYPRLDELPGIREWMGDRLIHELQAQTFIIRNRKFEETIGVLRDSIEDDQLGIYVPIAAQMGQNAAAFPDQLVWPLWNQGGATVCYDGQYFFDTDHPGWDANGAETSVSNYIAGAEDAWYLVDDSQVMKPMVWQSRKAFDLKALDSETDENVFMRDKFLYGIDGRCNAGFGMWQMAVKSKAALTPANYAAARTLMRTIRKRNGQILNLNPTKLIVPPSLEVDGRKIVEAALIDGGDSNIWKGTAELMVVPFLGLGETP